MNWIPLDPDKERRSEIRIAQLRTAQGNLRGEKN